MWWWLHNSVNIPKKHWTVDSKWVDCMVREWYFKKSVPPPKSMLFKYLISLIWHLLYSILTYSCFFFSWSNVASHPQNSGNDFWIVGFLPDWFSSLYFSDFFPNGCILLLHMKNRLYRNEIPLWIHLMLVQSLTHSRCLAMTCKYYW